MQSLSVSDIIAWEPPTIHEIVGCGLLPLNSRAIIFGRWGSFKSMISMDLGFSIASGRDWLGFNTRKSKVLVVQVEISQHNLQKRIAKYVANHIGDDIDNIRFWTAPYLRIDQKLYFDMLAREVNEVKPDVVIYDPVYRLMGGNLSENNAVTALLDRIDAIQNQFGLASILVSHTRKTSKDFYDLGQELIGGSFFQNWCDTSIGIELVNDSKVTMKFLKVRNHDETLPDLDVTINRETLKFFPGIVHLDLKPEQGRLMNAQL